MRTFSSAAAKNQFGRQINAARLEPVAVTKYENLSVAVIANEESEGTLSNHKYGASMIKLKMYRRWY